MSTAGHTSDFVERGGQWYPKGQSEYRLVDLVRDLVPGLVQLSSLFWVLLAFLGILIRTHVGGNTHVAYPLTLGTFLFTVLVFVLNTQWLYDWNWKFQLWVSRNGEGRVTFAYMGIILTALTLGFIL